MQHGSKIGWSSCTRRIYFFNQVTICIIIEFAAKSSWNAASRYLSLRWIILFLSSSAISPLAMIQILVRIPKCKQRSLTFVVWHVLSRIHYIKSQIPQSKHFLMYIHSSTIIIVPHSSSTIISGLTTSLHIRCTVWGVLKLFCVWFKFTL